MNKKKTILLLGDITGRSRVAVRMQTAALERRGHEVLALPTALISNTFSLGQPAVMDTSEYLFASLGAWERIGVAFDFVVIGYVTGMEQALRLCDFADGVRRRGVPVMLDPILGDNRKRYASVSMEQQQAMCRLMEHVDLITPNATEAMLIAGLAPDACADGAMEQAAGELARRTGGHSVLITGVEQESGEEGIFWRSGADAPKTASAFIPVDRVPGSFGGTGDLFTALLVDALLGGASLEAAARAAADGVRAELLREDGLIPRLSID